MARAVIAVCETGASSRSANRQADCGADDQQHDAHAQRRQDDVFLFGGGGVAKAGDREDTVLHTVHPYRNSEVVDRPNWRLQPA